MQPHLSPDPTTQLPGIPLDLRWRLLPESWEIRAGTLTVRAGARTDLFHDPAGSPPVGNAPHLLGSAAADFQLSARVTVDFEARFDAGALFVYVDPDNWAKLCFEFAPLREPTVVSVVTRGLSDDCNSYPVEGSSTWLRVARRGNSYAFHCSAGGAAWKLVRQFALGREGEVEVGFLAQSPEGDGCTVNFDSVGYRQAGLSDLRNGD